MDKYQSNVVHLIFFYVQKKLVLTDCIFQNELNSFTHGKDTVRAEGKMEKLKALIT